MKLTALQSPLVRRLLYSADSMAWSFDAARVCARMVGHLMRAFNREKIRTPVARRYYRRLGKHLPDANDWREAKAFEKRALTPSTEPEQLRLFAA
ncbi:MAG: hypothetical protein DI624_04185 [Brevundimonas sp.]|nr:MAG: hypothetical protein DI624_04185 [Brevundimonas sp.]